MGGLRYRVSKALLPILNITKRLASLETLRKSEERYRDLFESVPVGLYRTTPSGQILDANPALVAMLNYPDRESLLATNARDIFVNPEDRQRELDLLDQLGQKGSIEIQLRRFDGPSIYVRDTLRSVQGEGGEVLYYDGSLEDITEQKRAEQYLLRTERLAAMGQVMATLAHEIKNPLQGIQSNLELIRDFPLENDEREEHLQVCLREVDRLVEITRRMLSFSWSGSHTARPVSIPQIWEKTLALFNATLQSTAIQVTTDFPDHLPPILGVPDQINQVLINLVLNAIQAMPHGGIIHIAASVEREMLKLTLVNNGPPIPVDQLEHIFDPFFTTRPDGTGLGLFISHNIITQHRGTLFVENLEDGAGVAFTIILPVAPGPLGEESTL
jgi:two-component system, sporulation sensor kinase A